MWSGLCQGPWSYSGKSTRGGKKGAVGEGLRCQQFTRWFPHIQRRISIGAALPVTSGWTLPAGCKLAVLAGGTDVLLPTSAADKENSQETAQSQPGDANPGRWEHRRHHQVEASETSFPRLDSCFPREALDSGGGSRRNLIGRGDTSS